METLDQPFISLSGITKLYGVTRALKNVSLAIYSGKVIGLMGANGAGKSTLMKILSGVTDATSGHFRLGENEIDPDHYNPSLARSYGAATVYQELSLSLNLKVYENFYVDHKWKGRKWIGLAKKRAEAALETVFPGSGISVSTETSDLSLAERQMVEIARAVDMEGLRLLILDEPTSSLTLDRMQQLHQFLEVLRERKVSVIYISHKMSEIMQVADTIAIMRNGVNQWYGKRAEITEGEIIDYMGSGVGGQVDEQFQMSVSKRESRHNQLRVSFENTSIKGLEDVTASFFEGEIVGISGLEGSGQRQLLRAIFDQRRHGSKIKIFGRVAYMSGNRQDEGIFPYWSVAENITISSLKALTRFGILNKRNTKSLSSGWYEKLKFKAESEDASITSLSGGNQQKALVARVLASDAEIILLDDPTRGVDIQTKREVYHLLHEAAQKGKTLIWYSTEDKEMEQCDRVYVMSHKKMAAELVGDEISVSNIVKVSFENQKQQTNTEKPTATPIHLNVLKQRWFAAILAFICLYVIIGFLNPVSVSYVGIGLILSSAVPLALAAFSQMFIILGGDIDLGLGSFIGLVNVISATILTSNVLYGIVALLILVLLYGGMGLLIHVRKMPAIVVTLGASFVWLGIALVMQPTPGGKSPGWLNGFWHMHIPFLPLPIILSVVLAAVGYWILRKWKYGVVLRGFGNNPGAVQRSGWKGLRMKLSLYLLSALFAVLAGLAVTAVNTSADANASSTYTLLSIAAVILGGSEFFGGIVEPVGVVCGALTLSLIGSLLTLLSIGSNYQAGIEGIILLLILMVRGVMRIRGSKQ